MCVCVCVCGVAHGWCIAFQSTARKKNNIFRIHDQSTTNKVCVFWFRVFDYGFAVVFVC